MAAQHPSEAPDGRAAPHAPPAAPAPVVDVVAADLSLKNWVSAPGRGSLDDERKARQVAVDRWTNEIQRLNDALLFVEAQIEAQSKGVRTLTSTTMWAESGQADMKTAQQELREASEHLSAFQPVLDANRQNLIVAPEWLCPLTEERIRGAWHWSKRADYFVRLSAKFGRAQARPARGDTTREAIGSYMSEVLVRARLIHDAYMLELSSVSRFENRPEPPDFLDVALFVHEVLVEQGAPSEQPGEAEGTISGLESYAAEQLQRWNDMPDVPEPGTPIEQLVVDWLAREAAAQPDRWFREMEIRPHVLPDPEQGHIRTVLKRLHEEFGVIQRRRVDGSKAYEYHA